MFPRILSLLLKNAYFLWKMLDGREGATFQAVQAPSGRLCSIGP